MSERRPDFYLGTDIDGVHINAEQLNVRSTDLNQLIGSVSFTEALFHILHGRLPDEVEKKLFDLVLVAFHGGFGLLPPTTFVPRIVAGTGVTTAQALAAGFLASGPYHVGATEEAMRFYASVAAQFQLEHGVQPGQSGSTQSRAGQLEEYACQAAARRLAEGGTVGGFGHPLLRRDPRPAHIRRTLVDMQVDSPWFDIYDGIVRCMQEKKGVPPNVDGITGAILLHLGFQAQHGTGMFLLARAAAMLAHIIEEQTDMPYQTMKRFMLLPIAAPRLFNADFKKHARRFNKLRDTRVVNVLRNVVNRRARLEAEAKARADQAVISEYRSTRGQAILADVFPGMMAAVGEDAFVAAAHGAESDSGSRGDAGKEGSREDDAGNGSLVDSLIPDEDDDCSTADMIAGAEALLATCLDTESAPGAEQDAPPAEAVKLLEQALELVRQAGTHVDDGPGRSI